MTETKQNKIKNKRDGKGRRIRNQHDRDKLSLVRSHEAGRSADRSVPRVPRPMWRVFPWRTAASLSAGPQRESQRPNADQLPQSVGSCWVPQTIIMHASLVPCMKRRRCQGQWLSVNRTQLRNN